MGFGVFTEAFLNVTNHAERTCNVFVLHQVFIFVGHLTLFEFLFKSFGHPTLGIEDLLLDFLDGQQIPDVIKFRPALLSAFALQLVAVVAFLQLPLLLPELHHVACGNHPARGGRRALSAGLLI